MTSRGNATHGAGIHPGHVDEVIGITKAYITRVGNGGMPTELEDEIGHHLGTVGHDSEPQLVERGAVDGLML